MKREARHMWTLMLVFIALLVVLLAVKTWNNYQEEQETEQAEAEKIMAYEVEALSAISYEDYSGISESFSKSEETWTYNVDTSILLDADVMSQMETAFSNIEATKMIEEPDALSDYGLEEPLYTLQLADADGTGKTFFVGDSVSDGYYFMEENADVVYVISSDLVTEMLWEMADCEEEETFTYISEDAFIKQVITYADGTQEVFEQLDEEELNSTVSNAITSLAGMYFTDCVDYHVTEETLSNYGLDEASRIEINITYDTDVEEAEVTFYVGNLDEDETYYYVKLADSQQVNRVLKTTINNVLGKAEE